MGIGNRLKKMAFQPEEPEPVRRTEVGPSPRVSTSFQRGPSTFRVGSKEPSSPLYPEPRSARPAAEDPEIAAEIEQVLAKCQSRGYVELLTQLSALEAALPDEATRFSVAIAGLASMLQLTPDVIKTALQDRLTALHNHRTAVQVGLEAEVRETTANFTTSLSTCHARITELDRELEQQRRNAADFERELSEIQSKGAAALASIEVTFNRYQEELSGLLSRIR